jgi:hypothetical protein
MKQIAFCSLFLIAGCVTSPPLRPVDPPATQAQSIPKPEPEKIIVNIPSDVDQALKHSEFTSRLRGADLLTEYESVRLQFKAGQDELSRLKLAMMLLIPYASFHDEYAALVLLAPYQQDKNFQTSPFRPFALLVYGIIQDRKRNEETVRGQLQKVREDHRHTEDLLQQKLKEEHERAEQLQRKLDALLELERNLSGRDANPPRKP